MARTASRAKATPAKKRGRPAKGARAATTVSATPQLPNPMSKKPLALLAPYLGKRPDEWFAERIGRSIQTIAAMRLQANMPSYGERCRQRLPITVPDSEIERAITGFKNARKKYRHRGPTPGGW